MPLIKNGRLVDDHFVRILDDAPIPDGVPELEPYVDRLAVIMLAFPNFKDGRGYSQARQLRERYGFTGELRATGQILRDQFLFLIRAGFDSLEVKKSADVEVFTATLARYSVFYQPVGDTRVAAPQRRLARMVPSTPREMVR